MKSFDLRERLVSVDWQRILEDPHRLSTSFNRMLLVVLGRYTKGWSITAYTVAKEINRLYKINGFRFVSAYLKVCNTSLLNYLSKDYDQVPFKPQMYETRCSLTKGGLPRIILTKHRKIIRKGGPEAVSVIRCYLTLFGFYRTFVDLRKVANLKTIWTEGGIQYLTGKEAFYRFPNVIPGEHDTQTDLLGWLQHCFPALALSQIKGFPSEIKLGFNWIPTWAGGPNTRLTPFRTTVNVFRHDLNHWCWELVKEIPDKILSEKRDRLIRILSTHMYPFRTVQLPVKTTQPVDDPGLLGLFLDLGKPVLGRYGTLGRKFEGGGKVRVFAMLDSFRQGLLRPLHVWLMSALRTIPNDGTYNQVGPLYKIRDRKLKHLFSFDLTSATDRFPTFLQSAILQGFMGPHIALAWHYLMALPFEVPFLKKKLQVKFEIGQPLGAYSSWPAFTLSHHGIIQYSAQRAGLSRTKWFSDYAILGDDVIIGHSATAELYKDLVKLQGVKISPHKSIISNNGSCEFAKRFLWKGIDVSPVSFKEVYVMRRSTTASLVTRLSDFRDVSRLEPFRWFGASYKVLPSYLLPKKGRWKRFNLMLISPSGPFPLPFYWWCSLYSHRPLGRPESARVHQELLEKWQFSFEPEGIPTEQEEDIVEEVLIGRPWIRSWLRTSTSFLLNLMGEDPITAWFHRPTVPHTAERPKVERSFRLGKVYWIFDRMMYYSKKSPLKSLEG